MQLNTWWKYIYLPTLCKSLRLRLRLRSRRRLRSWASCNRRQITFSNKGMTGIWHGTRMVTHITKIESRFGGSQWRHTITITRQTLVTRHNWRRAVAAHGKVVKHTTMLFVRILRQRITIRAVRCHSPLAVAPLWHQSTVTKLRFYEIINVVDASSCNSIVNYPVKLD